MEGELGEAGGSAGSEGEASLMLWSVLWKNRKVREGLTSVEAESASDAALAAIDKIQSKYYWQGPVTVIRVNVARTVPAASGAPQTRP